MHRPQDQVRTFHKDVLHQDHSPAEPKLRHPELRARLILEEAVETVVALVGGEKALFMLGAEIGKVDAHAQPDIVEAIDGIADTIVVCYGTAEDIGIDLEPFFDEVHRSNMAKAGGEVRADGKRLKPEGWTPPRIAEILAALLPDAGVK